MIAPFHYQQLYGICTYIASFASEACTQPERRRFVGQKWGSIGNSSPIQAQYDGPSKMLQIA
ncbi:hypothetical protein Q31a_42300 [Aureliella helgolandensis]|uniref:Uncharacterized protein n=1 Tax=Aureliella helgolandensis TaxID=2527968 RepID=A0A518GBB4_9BACT|nr:hypothetical protein Q31a_42300 [Aureliella helgolandensis]